jgi:hypothetical protein
MLHAAKSYISSKEQERLPWPGLKTAIRQLWKLTRYLFTDTFVRNYFRKDVLKDKQLNLGCELFEFLSLNKSFLLLFFIFILHIMCR